MRLLRLLWALPLFLLGVHNSYAQVTTATTSGIISDAGGQPLEGATVKATHLPSGTSYGVISSSTGRYTVPNMRVGGPYRFEISYIGFGDETKEEVFLSLNQKLNLDFTLKESGINIGEIVVTGTLDPVLNGERTGAATSVSRNQIERLPTISRSAADYTRLNPMSAEGGSFGGRNDQFNNYSLDGTIFNNPFGLDAATPGGQTDAQPVSLDAIDQINVSIAPYDVTQSGFTGAAVNAVTKSGTNQFKGTVYGFYRNSGMTGSKVEDTEINQGDLTQLQTGFALGGPIVQNKVFFFANFELEKRSDLGSYFLPNNGQAGANISRVLASDMYKVSDLLWQNFGYETGAIEGFKHDADNTKALFKLDVNIDERHKLTATYNFLDAFKDKPAHPSAIGRRGPDFLTLQFQNSGYRIHNGLHSGIVELKSLFSSKVSNKLQLGFSAFKDSRDPFSAPFPVLNISKEGTRYIVAGHEPFSINNRLDQNVLQFNNNLNIYSGNHTFTLGTAFERFDFDNSFNLTGYGARVFFPDVDIADVEALLNSADFATEAKAALATYNSNNANNKWALAETTLGQWSIYGQDEWAVNPQLNLTFGLRMDLPLYFDTQTKIEENIARSGGTVDQGGVYAPNVTYYDEAGNPVKFDHTILPKTSPLINPRFGFNYDLQGDRSQQLRGGSGLFSGRFPFVWVGNQVANPAFFFYCITDPDFKFPQVWRTNLGYDRTLGKDWLASVDLLYTKDLNAAMVRNYGLKLPTGRLAGADTRPIYLAADRAQGPFGGATNAYVFSNTTTGYSFNAAFQIQRNWGNNFVSLAYNYLQSEDAASIDAEISSDAYDRNPGNIEHTNRANLAPSLYGNRHRIVGAFSKRFEYGEALATTISLFTEYAEGTRYSYTYSGDINNDGSLLNDLIYIPNDRQIDQMEFSGDTDAQQRQALRDYIAQDEYLSANQGNYAEKYGALSPWFSRWDLRLLQDIGMGGERKFQISLDVLNVGNLISSKWGVRQYATYTGLAQPLAVTVTNGQPVYSFDTAQKNTFFNDFSLLSRWQAQVGVRFVF